MKNKISEFSKYDCISFRNGKEIKKLYKAIEGKSIMPLKIANEISTTVLYSPTVVSLVDKEILTSMTLNVYNIEEVNLDALRIWNDKCKFERDALLKIN